MRFFLLAIISLFLQGRLYSQTSVSSLNEYSIQVWTTEMGLPSNNLRSVIQDSRGYIWVSSFNGLLRFDGNTFDIFNSDIISDIKSNGFSVINEDASGNLYFGTLTSGLIKYDGKSFSLYKIDSSFSKSITAISIDSDSNIWVGAQNSGLYTLNPDSKQFTSKEEKLLENTSVTSILESEQGDLWIVTANKGIFVNSSGQLTKLPPLDMQINDVREHKGEIYIGSSKGVYKYINDSWKLVMGTDGYFVNDIDHDSLGNLWVATETGLIRISNSGRAEYLTEENGLPSRQISSLLFDSEDNIWLATKRGGLAVLRKSNFINISTENGLSSSFVNTISQLKGGTMAIGNDNGTVDLMQFDEISQMQLKTSLTNVSIKDILQDKQENLWIATYRGIIKVNKQGEQLFTTSDGMLSNSPRCMFEDKSGNIWIVANDGGILMIRPDGSKKTYSTDNGLSDNYVFCIDQLPNGDIIAGTYHGGLNIISTDDKIKVIAIGIDNSSPIIFNIEIIDSDELWLATDVGLYKYQNDTFYQIDKNDGLLVKTVFDVETDDYGYLWVTSNQGVVRAEISNINDFISRQVSSIEARLYDEKDGMLSRECVGATKVFTSSSGNIWIPTSKGISVVDPGNIYINKKVPPVYIKDIKIDGEQVSIENEGVELKAGSQRLTIDYTALSFYSPAKINFKYRLKGFEQNWNEVGNKYQASYMNLPDGQFTFEVIASNNDGLWNEVPASLNVRIDPFFYQSRLFFLVLGGFVLLSAFIIYWIRIRVVEEKNKELHKLNEELDSFVYSVSHDLRAPLSSILGLISISKIEKDRANLPIYLEKIEISVNKLDNFIKEIISYSRNVRLKVEVEELDLRVLIEEVFEALAYMDPDNHIETSIESSGKSMIHSDKTRLLVILNNIISNGFRYYKSYINDSFIKVKIITTNTRAVISIEDNGIGIKPERLNKIFDMFYRGTDSGNGSGLGLYIAQESVAKLEGTITVESEYERGTTFTVTIDNL